MGFHRREGHFCCKIDYLAMKNSFLMLQTIFVGLYG